MDSFRELALEPEMAFGSHAPEPVEPSPPSTDERRMQVRAYNYWTSLLAGRDFPSIEDLEPASIADFAKNSVLLDFTSGPDNPTTPYVGAAVRRECDMDPDSDCLDDAPAGSLLAQLARHHPQVLADRIPVGVESAFVNQRGESLAYRGILMPFSSDGDTIDFVYGVLNWHQDAGPGEEELLLDQPDPSAPARSAEPPRPAEPAEHHHGWQDGPMRDPQVLQASDEATLSDWLAAARATAEDAQAADGRSRHALYQALALAYDFACAAVESPDAYRQLLDDSAITVQARAPMTAVAKLVFGADYDKARLTEYAAALSFAARQCAQPGEFLGLIESHPGGLKGMVEAERRIRRPDTAGGDWQDRVLPALRSAAPRPLDALAGNGEFALVLVRRDSDGAVSPVAAVADSALLDRALRRAAIPD